MNICAALDALPGLFELAPKASEGFGGFRASGLGVARFEDFSFRACGLGTLCLYRLGVFYA